MSEGRYIRTDGTRLAPRPLPLAYLCPAESPVCPFCRKSLIHSDESVHVHARQFARCRTRGCAGRALLIGQTPDMCTVVKLTQAEWDVAMRSDKDARALLRDLGYLVEAIAMPVPA